MEGKTGIKIGVWAFTIGVVLALLAGLMPNQSQITTPVLVLLGIIVGFLNVTEEEASKFLMSSVAIMIALYTAQGAVAAVTTLGMVGTYMLGVLAAINLFVFPATIVVAIKSIYALAKD